MSTASPQSLYNPEIECNGLSILMRAGPEVWGDFHLTDAADWSEPHRMLWDIINLQLSQTPPGSLDPLLLAEKLKGNGKTQLMGGFDIYEYLVGLTNRFVDKAKAGEYARELKRLRVRRDLIVETEATKRKLIESPNASFEEMTGLVEKGLTAVTTAYHKTETTEVMGNIIEVVEKRAASPLKAEDIGFLGPFRSINETIGPLAYRGAYVCVGARSAAGKSSLGWYHQTYLLEKYPQLQLLHLDAAEMTFEELAWRAVCCLSKGVIPYHAVYSGEWANNPAWVKLVRGELWPRVMKMKDRMHFKNVGPMSPKERISFMRRFYHNKVGRDNHLLIHDDYLKGVESMNQRTAEHQAMGFYVGDQKTLITEEIDASIWTSVQKNQSGISNGKKPDEINDGEGTFSLSDRIFQQTTHSFSMRFKTDVELAKEMARFGNIRLNIIKKRQLLGKRYRELLKPVKMGSSFVPNYVNLNTEGFWYEDRGLLSEMVETLGLAAVDMKAAGTAPAQQGI